jgi:hypothetical protein
MIRYFHLKLQGRQALAMGEILKSENFEMPMVHFSGAPSWAG